MNLDKSIKKKTGDLVITYVLNTVTQPENPEICKVIQFNLSILHEDPKMNGILPNFIRELKITDSLAKQFETTTKKAEFSNSDHHEVKRC